MRPSGPSENDQRTMTSNNRSRAGGKTGEEDRTMKKIINGRRYDTKTATLLGEYDNGYSRSDFNWYAEKLYQKRTGEYFLWGRGGPMSKYAESHGNETTGGEEITLMSAGEARTWAEEHLDADEYADLFDVTPDEPATVMQTVGANIRKAREAAGMTQTDLAEKVGSSQSVIGRYERGEMDPTASRLVEIIRAIGCSPADIL